MISIIQNGPIYEIRFPYNTDVIALVKNVAGRRWHKEDKFWSIPKDKLGFFLSQIKNTPFENQIKLQSDEDIDVNETLEDTPVPDIPNIDISDVKTYVKEGSKLFKHQEDCLKYSIARKEKGNFNGFLLADEMGCLSGSSIVEVDVNGRRKSMSLQTLYQKFSHRQESDAFLIKSYVPTNKGMFSYLQIRCVLSKGPMFTVKVTFYDGSYVICTPDHELLTNRGWVCADKLVESDLILKDHIDYNDKFKAVLKVDNYGIVEVYDVGVLHNSAHNFVCNDVVVHNCGKTLEVINLAMFKKQYEAAKHCLVICCVNSAKYNWAEDISTHTNGQMEGYILGSRQSRKGTLNLNGSGTQKLQDLETGLMYSDKKLNKPLPYFLILNIEALRTTDKAVKKKSMKDVLTLKLAEMCIDGNISMIAIDEIHRNASPQSAQGSELLKLKTMTGNHVEWIPMTGTPIVNKPTDAFLPLRLVNAHEEDSYWRWNHRYCVYGGYNDKNIIGYKNIPELKSILEPNMLRRTKDKVLDLPKKIHHVEYVENSRIQQQLYFNEQMQITQAWHEGAIERSRRNPLVLFMKLRQINSCPEVVDDTIDPKASNYLSVNAKIGRLVELVQDIVNSGEKAVVFSNWLAPLRSAYRCLKKKKINVTVYTGNMAQAEREANKSKFIHDPKCSVILGTVGALGTSHTLSVASNVIFIDEPWNAAALDQAEDRCYRLDSKKPVNIYSIIAKDTVDEKVHKIIQTKRGTSNYIVDNELNFKDNPELIEMLLS